MMIPEPTPAMIEFFERRTREHIARVRRCLEAIAPHVDCAAELQARAAVHDASKFAPEEYLPYVWLTEFHRCRRAGEPFRYPNGVEPEIRNAVLHHFAVNRHHPEFHGDPNAMTDADVIEMVCDWTAMAEEFEDGSARPWADKTVGVRIRFNAEKTRLIYAMIGLLERLPRTDAIS